MAFPNNNMKIFLTLIIHLQIYTMGKRVTPLLLKNLINLVNLLLIHKHVTGEMVLMQLISLKQLEIKHIIICLNIKKFVFMLTLVN